jgi:hypothetical protein
MGIRRWRSIDALLRKQCAEGKSEWCGQSSQSNVQEKSQPADAMVLCRSRQSCQEAFKSQGRGADRSGGEGSGFEGGVPAAAELEGSGRFAKLAESDPGESVVFVKVGRFLGNR